MHVSSNLGVVFNLPQFPCSFYPNLFFPKKWRPPELTCNIILATIKSSSSEDNAPPWLCLRWCECGFHLAQFPSQYSHQILFSSKKKTHRIIQRVLYFKCFFFFHGGSMIRHLELCTCNPKAPTSSPNTQTTTCSGIVLSNPQPGLWITNYWFTSYKLLWFLTMLYSTELFIPLSLKIPIRGGDDIKCYNYYYIIIVIITGF